jgi:hypothetical protein
MATISTYHVEQDYSSGLGTFEKGSTVELDDDLAEHIERDSPGTLKHKGGKRRAVEHAPSDRMVRAAPNRAFPDGPPLSRIPPPQYPLVPPPDDAKIVQDADAQGTGPAVRAELIADSPASDPGVTDSSAPADPAKAVVVDTTKATDATSAGNAYDGKNVTELRELAAAKNIEGRSSMTKDELVAALDKADQGK